MNATEKKIYMREYRKRMRQSPEGRAKLRAANQRWKKSENGKKAAREWAKKKYVPHPLPRKTPAQFAERRARYWAATAGPKRTRKRNDEMGHLKRYGLTKEQYLTKLAEQGGGCAICGTTNGSSRNPRVLCVDHCHHTGMVRGLLCDNCNRGIGALKDDAGLVRKAALYLEAYHG